MNKNSNSFEIIFDSKSENESFARVSVASFIAQLDPTLEEINDVKTAVSEAVTNSIIHGYDNDENGIVSIETIIKNKEVIITVEDNGQGIEDIEEAREPLYTSKPELERSGMGFTVMETFMNSIEVFSEFGKGTKVVMKKSFQ